ncbi:hypothetical protein WR25_15410 [Diploscapter pachys]|uniref:Uncharacterized protein n=1 Tax=Diploscapter pachys TaxID=2018661 RepID=A0A2A2LNT8_9BILA|nr:hypothetical protein WR25_15410 [Diploscapter pachys]
MAYFTILFKILHFNLAPTFPLLPLALCLFSLSSAFPFPFLPKPVTSPLPFFSSAALTLPSTLAVDLNRDARECIIERTQASFQITASENEAN